MLIFFAFLFLSRRASAPGAGLKQLFFDAAIYIQTAICSLLDSWFVERFCRGKLRNYAGVWQTKTLHFRNCSSFAFWRAPWPPKTKCSESIPIDFAILVWTNAVRERHRRCLRPRDFYELPLSIGASIF